MESDQKYLSILQREDPSAPIIRFDAIDADPDFRRSILHWLIRVSLAIQCLMYIEEKCHNILVIKFTKTI